MTPTRRKWLHLDAVHRMVLRAMSEGGYRRVSQMHATWDVSGGCTAPTHVELYARPDLDNVRSQTILPRIGPHPFWLELTVPCRTCAACLTRKRKLWAARASQEFGNASRTWFGTLTLTPEAQHLALSRARSRLYARSGLDFETLAGAEQFRLRCNEISPALTKYLKRLRKQSGAPLRYLLVTEAHKSGNPHFHMLIHEVSMFSPVRHATLSAQWHLGFTKWKLIYEVPQATYVCKYLAKSSLSRVRASIRYGSLNDIVTREYGNS